MVVLVLVVLGLSICIKCYHRSFETCAKCVCQSFTGQDLEVGLPLL